MLCGVKKEPSLAVLYVESAKALARIDELEGFYTLLSNLLPFNDLFCLSCWEGRCVMKT